MMEERRIISWFSCGAASAVATKLAIASGRPVTVAYCAVKEEHPDNERFLKECEEWFGQSIEILMNEKYSGSIYEVFEKTRYLVGPSGARCTGELKKEVRKAYQKPNDLQVFGYTSEEQGRVDRFLDANADVDLWPILVEKNLSKKDCLGIIDSAGIELPAMYKLGYRNNNCVGCVKGGSGYWNKIRVDFPEAFQRMSEMEQHLGRTICSKTVNGVKKRIPLTELHPDDGHYPSEEAVECGIFCEATNNELDGWEKKLDNFKLEGN